MKSVSNFHASCFLDTDVSMFFQMMNQDSEHWDRRTHWNKTINIICCYFLQHSSFHDIKITETIPHYSNIFSKTGDHLSKNYDSLVAKRNWRATVTRVIIVIEASLIKPKNTHRSYDQVSLCFCMEQYKEK